MANMSYCGFENTLTDLQDCYEHMEDDDLSESEIKARRQLIIECRNLAGDYGREVDDDE